MIVVARSHSARRSVLLLSVLFADAVLLMTAWSDSDHRALHAACPFARRVPI